MLERLMYGMAAAIVTFLLVGPVAISQTNTIDDQTELTAPVGADQVFIWDSDAAVGSRTKKATLTNFSKGLSAGNIPNTPAGDIAATDVQSAIDELDTEKAPLASPSFTGNVSAAQDIVLDEQADHSSTPAAGKGYMWTKNTTPSTLFFTDDAGTDHRLAKLTEWTTLAGASTSWDADGTLTILSKDYDDERCYWFSFASDTTAPTGDFTIDIPDTFDTAKLPNSTTRRLRLGHFYLRGTSINHSGEIHYADTNTVDFLVHSVGSSYVENAVVSPTVPVTFGGAGHLISGKFCGPLV